MKNQRPSKKNGKYSEPPKYELQCLYQKTRGSADMSGELYEIKVASLVFVRGLRYTESFQLAANLAGAGAFDDIVFKYRGLDPNNKCTICFLQLKHKKEGGKKATIRDSDIQAVKGDFSLPKYCSSYNELKKKFATEIDHPIFKEEFDSCMFGIYTNACWDRSLPGRVRDFNAEKLLNSGGEVSPFSKQCNQSAYTFFEDLPRYHKFLCDLKVDLRSNGDIGEKIDNFCKTIDTELEMKLLGLKRNLNIREIQKLINAVNNLGDFSGHQEFLPKLCMFTSQASETELDQVIKSEIQEMLSTTEEETIAITKELIENVQKWWKNGNYYLSETSPFWKSIVQIRLDRISHINDMKRQELDGLGFKYNFHGIQGVKDSLKSNSLVNIIADGESTVLSCLKVYQVLQEEDFGYLMVGMEMLIHFRKEILSLWPSKWSPTLVIDCDGFVQNLDKMWGLIFETVKLDRNQNVIVVSNSSDISESLRQKVEENFVVFVDKFSFTHLSTKSQQALLTNTLVQFQGLPMPLSCLIDRPFLLSEAINVTVLFQLINNNCNIKAGEKLDSELKYYIPRVLECSQCINTTILATSPTEFSGAIAVSGYTIKDLMKYVPKGTEIRTVHASNTLITEACEAAGKEVTSLQVRNNTNVTCSQFAESTCYLFIIEDNSGFQQLCQNYSIVHWLTRHEENGVEALRWVKSHGDIDLIYQHLNIGMKTVYNSVNSVPDRIILVVAEAGMGKSTLLSHLAVAIKQANPVLWVIRANLNDHTSYLDKIDPAECNVDKVFQFLCLTANVESLLERKLLQYYFEETGNLAVLLDGYDEISPTHAQKAGAILQCLCRTKVRRLWISSRPIMRTFLEKILSVFAFTLKPFSVADQQNFMLNFWKSRLPNVSDNAKDLAESLLILCSKFLDINFMGIPLQTMMLAEAYENHIATSQKAENIDLPENMNLLQLYDKFVDRKVEIYCKEKKKIDTTNTGVKNDNEHLHNLFLECHILASMTTLFPPSEYGHLYTNETKTKMEDFVYRIQEGYEKTGIINNVLEGKPQFIHRTFADYFVGKCLSFRFNSSEGYDSVHRSIRKYFTNRLFVDANVKGSKSIYETILDHDFKVVRNILDRTLSRDLQLHSALISQDRPSIQRLIAERGDVNLRDKGGRTPLHLAVCYCAGTIMANKEPESGTQDLAVELLDKGADMNAEDDVLRWRPLRYADRIKAWDMIETFLQNKATTEDLVSTRKQASRGKERHNLLYIATSRGYVKLLQFVVQTKLKSTEDYQRYARYEEYMLLRTAVMYDQWEVLRFLVANHTDINVKHGEGDSILHWASRQGKPEAISQLVELGADINARNYYGNTPLHCAAQNGSLSVVTMIVSKGGDVSITNNDGNTALYQAAGQGMWHVVNHLLHLGSNINIGSSLGNTPLHWAAEKGEVDIICQLVESHADINICNSGGNTPLHWAVWKGTSESIRMIVRLGAYVDAWNNQLETPVYWAAKQSQWSKVEELINLGADVNICNNKGNVPLHWAAKHGNCDIITRLAKLGPVDVANNHGNTALHFAAGNGKCELVSHLVHLGASVNAKNKSGNTPLHWAVGEDQQDTVRLLARLGADLRARNNAANAVIHIAAGQKRKEADERFLNLNMDTRIGKSSNKLVYRFYGNDNVALVKLLIGLGCNMNAHNKNKDTPLHRAALLGNLNVVKYLLQLNVPKNVRNQLGLTPLDLAFKKKSSTLAIIKVLQEHGALRGNILMRFIPV